MKANKHLLHHYTTLPAPRLLTSNAPAPTAFRLASPASGIAAISFAVAPVGTAGAAGGDGRQLVAGDNPLALDSGGGNCLAAAAAAAPLVLAATTAASAPSSSARGSSPMGP